ncbi:MAG: hypothetical protein BGO86_15565 [Chryseobacterium sp. 36-9]|mgnify:CR=1 FL=1|nr:MAG: hypothetical protein BGO86_15565 [Chryseobacterium sp. 36-9]
MKNIIEIEEYLNVKYLFRYNIVSMRTEYSLIENNNFRPLDERKLKSLFIELNRNNINVAKTNLESLLNSDYSTTFNPFTDFFDNLPKVLGTKNIDLLCKTVKTHDDEFFKWAFTKWIVAMVGNMIDENVINHQCVVLSGNQGLGKTTWVKHLLPDKLKTYYHEGNIKFGNNDSLKNISTKCLINLDELAGMTRTQTPMLKELITKSSTELRKAYAHLDDFFVRRASFIGSINGGDFLYDLTGNRRFLCFEIEEFENKGYHNVNMDLVFAEAYQLYKNGFQYWFDAEDQKRVEKNNEHFIAMSRIEIDLLKAYSPIPFSEQEPELYKAALSVTIAPKEKAERFYYRKKRIDDCINFNEKPKRFITSDLRRDIGYGTGTQGELIKFGKTLNKHKFKSRRSKFGTEYEVFGIVNPEKLRELIEV